MKIEKLLPIISIMTLIVMPSAAKKSVDDKYTLITKNATEETINLYQQLATMQGEGILFGHHYSNVSGIDFLDWEQTMNQCDVKKSVSDYPAMFGFDFGNGFTEQLAAVKDAAKRGGVVTISDHMRNPLAPESHSHIKGLLNKEIKCVLPGGKHHDLLIARLDSIASFASRAVVDGRKIPIIYRPWHEHTGRWFWWGSESGSADEYCELWKFTINYLRDKKGVDNFIYAFSPSQFAQEYDYEIRNPGAKYFDIAGIDMYTVIEEPKSYVDVIEVVIDYAEAHNKVPALTEFGYRGGINNCEYSKWFTDTFLNPILESEKARKITFALTWRNSPTGYWVPLKEDHLHRDFIEFYKSPYTIFLKEWDKIKVKQ